MLHNKTIRRLFSFFNDIFIDSMRRAEERIMQIVFDVKDPSLKEQLLAYCAQGDSVKIIEDLRLITQSAAQADAFIEVLSDFGVLHEVLAVNESDLHHFLLTHNAHPKAS